MRYLEVHWIHHDHDNNLKDIFDTILLSIPLAGVIIPAVLGIDRDRGPREACVFFFFCPMVLGSLNIEHLLHRAWRGTYVAGRECPCSGETR